MRSYHDHLFTAAHFARYFGLNPLSIAGFCCNPPDENRGCLCDSEWWSEDIRRHVSASINEAERQITNYLGYNIAPRYTEGFSFDYPEGGFTRKAGDYKRITIPNGGYLLRFGFRTLIEVSETAVNIVPVTSPEQIFLTDAVAVPSGTLAGDIRVFFAESDRNSEPLELWEISPLTDVSIVSDEVIVSIPAFLLGVPDADECLDPENVNSFVDSVVIYRQTFDPCQQGIVSGFPLDCSDTFPEPIEAPVKVRMEKPIHGLVRIMPAVCSNNIWSKYTGTPLTPSQISLNFEAGRPLVNGAINPVMLGAVAKLAASKMACEFPKCDSLECIYSRVMDMRKTPVIKTGEGGDEGIIGNTWTPAFEKKHFARNPFGEITQGAILAWNDLIHERILR